MRCVLYHRVSTRDQDEELPLVALRRVAAVRGLEVVAEVTETGSGARNDRPGLHRVLDLARQGDVDSVLVWSLDRAGRSVLDVLSTVRQLNECGVTFVATSQGLTVSPGGDAMSNLLLQVLAACAQFERAIIHERVKLGIEKARRAGVRFGRTPKVTDLRRALELRERGLAWPAVARELGCTVSAARRAVERACRKDSYVMEQRSTRDEER